MEKIKVAVIGAGNRGKDVYAKYILENGENIQLVGVAEPISLRREQLVKEHNIPAENVFDSWEKLLAKDKFCDAVIISTDDDMHFYPTVEAMKKGYNILLEKPMSNKLKECFDISELSTKYNVKILVCHVLRYTPFFSKVKELITKGEIGEIISIQHNENIGNFHFAHSFCRGNWRNSDTTSPLILAKSCHDMDLLSWLVDSPCKKISAFGSLKHFRKECAPEGSAERCLECSLIDSCIYSPKKIYYNNIGSWPTFTVTDVHTEEGLTEALKTGKYGKCVYHTDNNVVDHMVTIMEFDNGVDATFNLSAFTDEVCRTFKIMGTKGEIRGYDSRNLIEVHKFGQGEGRFCNGNIEIIQPEQIEGGHGGGDNGLMKDFIEVCRGRGDAKTNAHTSVQSHIMAFAAEQSRLDNKVVSIDEFVKTIK